MGILKISVPAGRNPEPVRRPTAEHRLYRAVLWCMPVRYMQTISAEPESLRMGSVEAERKSRDQGAAAGAQSGLPGRAVRGRHLGPKSRQALGSHYVRRGERQYLVTAAEILLMLKDYTVNGVESPGIFGSGLEQAVKSYQKAQGLSVDGMAGSATFLSLIG